MKTISNFLMSLLFLVITGFGVLPASAQNVSHGQQGKIDVHQHFVPDVYRKALIEAGLEKPDGLPIPVPAWSETEALSAMDKAGIDFGYLSISSPGVNFGDNTAARTLARQVNEEGSRLAKTYPDRFGFFASLPLPDVDGAVAEAVYALDKLGADGVILQSNSFGMYLGDERLEPLYAELNRRQAVVFVHPTSPRTSCGCDVAGELSLGYPTTMIEFFFDTSRSITDMVLSGTLDKYPNMRVIVPHAGSVLPMVASRVDLFGKKFFNKSTSMHDALRSLYYDLAGMPLPDMLPALLKITDASHILYGSDFPFTPIEEIEQWADRLDRTTQLNDGERTQVMRINAEQLFRTNNQPITALTGVYLIDGTGKQPIENATILIEGDRITAVGQDLIIPTHAQIINLPGKTVMPGLIDAHVHMGAQIKIGDVRETRLGGGERLIFGGKDFTDNYREARETSLAYGITTTRSAGDFLNDILALKEDTGQGKVRGPRIVAGGPSFQQPGGHPGSTVWGDDPLTIQEAARRPVTTEEARRMVSDLAAKGVDFIKIIISDTRLGMERNPKYKLPWNIIDAITDEAHRHDLIVVAHIENAADARRAIQAGIDDIEHLFLHGDNASIDYDAYDEVFRLMVENGTYLTPTMIVSATGLRPIEEIDMSALTYGNKLIRRAFDAGVKIAAGTDAGAPELAHGWALHAELALMVNDQGIPALEAIKSATSTNAGLLGKSADLGTVAPGKLADLLIINGNPLNDITNTTHIKMVIQGGQVVVDNR